MCHCVNCAKRAGDLTKRITSRRGALHVEVIGLVTATPLGAMGEVLVRVSVPRIFSLALVVGGVGAGDVQLRLRGRGIPRGRQRWRFIVVP